MSVMDKTLQKRLIEARRFFSSDKYKTVLSLASLYLDQDRPEACKEQLDRLPTKDDLLERLVKKLEGKSVYKTLRQIHENKGVDTLTKMKGLSSLVTHCIIEMQSSGTEYGFLLPSLLEKEQELLLELSLGVTMPFKKLAKGINKLLKDMSMITFNESELLIYIETLSDNALEALEDAIKNKEVVKIFNILGMKSVTSFSQKSKGNTE